jgi:hypothetical protein
MAIKISGDTVINDGKIFLPNNSAEVATALTINDGEITIDLNNATVFTLGLTASVTSVLFENVQNSGRASSFVLVVTGDGTARSIIWPASFKWPEGTAPTITSTNGKKDVFVFFTTDGGTTWQAFIAGQDL